MIKCRICNNNNLSLIHNYKKNAFAGSLLKKNQIKKEKKHELKLLFCNQCFHLQIDNLIEPSKLFKNYLWETGISKSNLKLINNLVSDIKKYTNKKKRSNFFEIASNDGSCLKVIKKKLKGNVVGIDPAKNIAKKANKEGIYTINNFFSFNFSKSLNFNFKKFDFCLARNVIAHVHDPVDIFFGVKEIISENGIFILEFPHLLNIYKELQFDNVFHEHIGYHSLKSIIDICGIVDMKVINVKKIDSQGGSLRIFITNNKSKRTSNNVNKILKEEHDSKIYKKISWMKFSLRLKSNINKLEKLFKTLRKQNKKIAVYGASGKGQTLLQLINQSGKYFDHVYDKSKLKEGLYTPGTHILIRNPSNIYKDKPDFIFVCTWNLIDEIMIEHKKYTLEGGKFIIPFPNPKILK